MSEYTIFWYWNQIIRDDTDLSTREKKDCATAIAVLPAPLVKQGIASLK